MIRTMKGMAMVQGWIGMMEECRECCLERVSTEVSEGVTF